MLFTKEEYKERLKKVQSSMQQKGIELLISQDTANMNYLTGYDAWSFYYAQCVIVHVNAEEPLCFVRAQDAGGAYIKTYLKKENFNVTSNSYFDIESDFDIGKVDQNYLYEVLSKIDLKDADALFVSCTALPVLPIIDKLEKKLNKPVLSSNQALIWDTLENIGKNNSIKGFGKLFLTN